MTDTPSTPTNTDPNNANHEKELDEDDTLLTALASPDEPKMICQRIVFSTKTPSDTNMVQYLGERIDKVATFLFAQLVAQYSREQVKDWIADGSLTINGKNPKPKYRIKQGDILELNAQLQPQQADIAENIALDIVYEDDALLIINKPDGMVVHPGAGNPTGTLVNALLYHYPQSRLLPRAGLVHRIDKHTTGLLVVAKDSQSQLQLIDQLKQKTVYRHYQALVLGSASELNQHPIINAPIARHPTQRTKMAVVSNGKPAITHLDTVRQICDGVCLVNLHLETGRTHQIRVHLSHLGFPLLSDLVYGSARKTTILLNKLDDTQQAVVKNFTRQALHAYELGLLHPTTGEPIKVTAPLPADMQRLILALQS